MKLKLKELPKNTGFINPSFTKPMELKGIMLSAFFETNEELEEILKGDFELIVEVRPVRVSMGDELVYER